MSTLTGKASNGMPEHFVFPSDQHPNNKILCISHGNKSYAFASTFPENTTLLKGLTFIADSFYDYENPWHGLNAVAGFFAWMRDNECKKPRRFLLFKNGEVVKRVGNWVYNLMKAGLGGEVVEVESLEGRDGEVVCFERAVVMRRGLGGMSGKMRNGLFEMLRLSYNMEHKRIPLGMAPGEIRNAIRSFNSLLEKFSESFKAYKGLETGPYGGR
ncbi:hypothetical protein J5N97_008261 [Dioscorea zingiberensis]|uniref:Uncharacterized protein n=1 Tax=Dioscorea zingiberensis TaxID=325984 RepID=A0A9D5DGI3_9LILI|nr:hypothetical protein J5N97_008261 [Dioscorea zingiberensis]